MDRLIATNSVNYAGRDIAPVSGTPQYATDGVPGTTPATIWPAYAFNQVQDEIIAVIAAAGLTPDDTNWAQLLQAIRTLAHGYNMAVYKIVGGVQQVSINGAAFTAASATTFTPAYTGKARVRGSGAGGGSGAAVSGGASGGGAAGTYGEAAVVLTAGTPISVTVGSPGAAGSGSGGGTGGASSFGSVSWPGGGGSPQVTTATSGAGGASGGDATGCNLSIAGAPGSSGGTIGGSVVAGAGGGGPLGIGGFTNFAGQDLGGGGGGTQGNISTTGLAGGPGIVIVEY